MTTEINSEWSLEVILKAMHRHLQRQQPVLLCNIYKGVPIRTWAEIAMIHPMHIGLIVHPYQAVCIKHDHRTYIESKFVPGIIRADSFSIDFKNLVVLLKNMTIPQNITKDFSHAWVFPEASVEVELDSDLGARLTAEMMSLAVLPDNKVKVAVAVPEDVPYGRLDAINLAFRLPGKPGLVQVGGVVHSLTKVRNQTQKRLEVEGKATLTDEVTLLEYVAQREAEAQAELKEEYQSLRKLH